MYDKKNLAYLLTALEAIEKLWIYTAHIRTADELLQKDDQLIFNACQTLLMTVGEECKKIDSLLRAEYPEIPWGQIMKLRNRIAHDYRSVNPKIAFDVIENYLQPLKFVLVEMVR